MVFCLLQMYTLRNIITILHGQSVDANTVYKNYTGSWKYLRPTLLHMQVLIYHMVNAITACRLICTDYVVPG